MANTVKAISFKREVFSGIYVPLTGLWYSIDEVSIMPSSVIMGSKNLVPSSDTIIPEGEAKK